ncbi:SPOR domain-containing protein [Kineococcus esterisolvens]|uniref:SPOR domain-containing protein n=1 Tax=unclassified Kineococcus TaxID=2621656 RepID=UPI003D7CFC77
MAPTNPVNGKGTYEIRIGLWASLEQAQAVQERLMAVLCPEPEHAGPCEVPWSISLAPPDAVDEAGSGYEELVVQAKIEGSY